MMKFEEWMGTVPCELTNDPLWKMQVYRLAVLAGELAWPDVTKLFQDKRMIGLAGQLYEAIGSVSANIAEGYSHRSHKDQARFYEYALGSARESRDWYYKARHILTAPVALHRMKLLTEIIRLLLTIIPAERGYKIAEERESYDVFDSTLLDNPPLP